MVLQIFEITFTNIYQNNFSRNKKISFFCCDFALKTLSLPRKIMEQCGLCPVKLWSNADFAPQNHGHLVLCPTKPRRLHSLPRGIMEQCRLCPAKSWIHSSRRPQISLNLMFFFFLIFCKSMLFQISLQTFGPFFLGKNIFCHGTFKYGEARTKYRI